MRVISLSLLALAAVAGRALPAQQEAPRSYAMALEARYLPLESVRNGTVRMPKPLAGRVSVHRSDVLLQQVLLDIATQAGLGLSYGEDLARSNTRVTVELSAVSAAEALAAAVRGTQWSVLVTAAGQVAVVPSDEEQLGIVAGRVTDRTTGRPVVDAALRLAGTPLGARTGEDGAYRIADVPPGTYAMSVRRIGYAPASRSVDVAADRTTTADVALDAAATTLDEIVVTGTAGAVSKRTLGNSITTLDAEELTRKSTTANVTELLQAKAPGLTILPGGGTPGTGASIRIRGAGSLTAATAPVIYIDGVRMYSGAQGNFWNSWRSQRPGDSPIGAGQDAMALDMLRPEDIESIEVIKGPAAATLYGAEAANGVIQIITRRGTRGDQPLRWNLRVEGGANEWAVDRVTNYTTCTQAVQDLAFGDGSPRFPGCQDVPTGTVLTSRSLDLPGALRTGDVRSYGLQLQGGGTSHSYFAAAERDEEQGVFLNSMNQRSAGRANFSLVPSPKLDVAINVGYTHTHTQFPINDDGYGLIQSAMLYRPGYEVGAVLPGKTDGFDGGNGPAQIYQWDNHLRANRTTIGATANYQPFPWLRNRLTVGLDQTSRLADKYLPPGSIWGGVDGLAERGAPENSMYSLDWSGTISTAIPRTPLTSDFSAGTQYTASYYRNTIARGWGFASPAIRQVALAASTSSFSEYQDVKSLGLYLQEQVGWNDRLFVTAAIRVDNNSVFGDNIDRLYFPKLSAAWVVSEEPFFARVPFVGELKLRAAWGQAGNAPAPFAGQRSYTSGVTVNDAGAKVPALALGSYGNPDIKPERGSEIELGADATMLDGRLGLDLTVYDKTTKDAILAIPVAASTGFSGVRFENLGEISNRGVEVSLTASPLRSATVDWESRLGFATNRNELVSFGYDRGPIVLSLYQPVQRHEPGRPLGAYWGNFPERDASGNLVRDAEGRLVAGEQRYIGPSTPTREISFGNTVTLWERLRLYALLDYKGGHYLYNVKEQYRCWGQPFATTWSNDADVNIPGSCAAVNDVNASDEYKEVRQQDPSINNGIFIERADFIKLRDVSVTYLVPPSLLRRLGTDRASFTIAAHNLGFLWKPHYSGPDPEVNFTGINDPGSQFAFIRVDSWTAPMTRRITASLDVGF
jgi:TonB-linked SusC/RagA family outer membrane protein